MLDIFNSEILPSPMVLSTGKETGNDAEQECVAPPEYQLITQPFNQ